MQELITASEILDFTYCPRRWYLHTMESQQNNNYYLLVEGDELHKSMQSHTHLLENSISSECEVSVYNHSLNIYGVCDRVEHIISDDFDYIVPIEIKHGKQRDCNEYKTQLMSYGFCLEEMFNLNIPFGYIYYNESNNLVRVDFNEKLRNFTTNIINEIRKHNLKYNIAPHFCRKCNNCSMFETCRPKEYNIKEYMNKLWEE